MKAGLELSEDTPEEGSLKAEWRLSVAESDDTGQTETIYLGEISSDRRQELIAYMNEEIRDLKAENAIVVTKNGEVWLFVGNADNVVITGVKFDGTDALHNDAESNGIVSFGKDDFEFLKANQNISSLRCCNTDYNYATWTMKPIDDVVYGDVRTQVLDRAYELYKVGEDCDVQDLVMQRLSEMGYLRYEKHEVDGGL